MNLVFKSRNPAMSLALSLITALVLGATLRAESPGTLFVAPPPKDPFAMHKLKGGPAGLYNGKVVNLVP